MDSSQRRAREGNKGDRERERWRVSRKGEGSPAEMGHDHDRLSHRIASIHGSAGAGGSSLIASTR